MVAAPVAVAIGTSTQARRLPSGKAVPWAKQALFANASGASGRQGHWFPSFSPDPLGSLTHLPKNQCPLPLNRAKTQALTSGQKPGHWWGITRRS